MKNFIKILIVFFSIGMTLQGFAQEEEKNGPKIKFEEESHSFGDVKQGEKVSHKFTFKNTGNQPLVLSNVLSSCGCTVTEWPKEPIQPGKSSEIEVKFNSTNRMGKENKVITIFSNAITPQTRIKITATVVES